MNEQRDVDLLDVLEKTTKTFLNEIKIEASKMGGPRGIDLKLEWVKACTMASISRRLTGVVQHLDGIRAELGQLNANTWGDDDTISLPEEHFARPGPEVFSGDS